MISKFGVFLLFSVLLLNAVSATPSPDVHWHPEDADFKVGDSLMVCYSVDNGNATIESPSGDIQSLALDSMNCVNLKFTEEGLWTVTFSDTPNYSLEFYAVGPSAGTNWGYNVLLLFIVILIALGEKMRDPVYMFLGIFAIATAVIELPSDSLISRWILVLMAVYLIVKMMIYGRGFVHSKRNI